MIDIDKINRELNKNIRKYSLPKVIQLVIAYLQKEYPEDSFDELYKRISYKGNHSLSFQRSDLKELFFRKDKFGDINIEITLNFLSIFGSSSPMPSHYCEMVLNSYDSDQVLYDFLNIFNNNIQKFVYPIWEKNRYYSQYKRDLSDKFSKYVLSFLGLYSYTNKKNDSLNLQKLIPFIGLLSMPNLSANTLKIILTHYLSHDNIEIMQCIKSSYKIPEFQKPKLGDANSSLGMNFLIGDSIVSKNTKFRIILKDADVSDLENYSVNGNKMNELNELISFVINEPLEYEVYFEIKKHKKQKASLSLENPSYMGVNSWIGDSLHDEQILIAKNEI